ncbi:MAG: aldo/keto reductase, partial [Spirochaetota bacterium]
MLLYLQGQLLAEKDKIMTIPEITLNNGTKIPAFGLGTYKATGNDVEKAVLTALENGYRHIDTASLYENEDIIGRAIRKSSIERSSIFLTSKVWNSEQGYSETHTAFERSLNRLQTDYLDLYLIHWPQPKNHETWKAMEELYMDKKVRSIGVSNFDIHHLEKLMQKAEVQPVLNQIELHPHLKQQDIRTFCSQHKIAVEAWAPLMRG